MMRGAMVFALGILSVAPAMGKSGGTASGQVLTLASGGRAMGLGGAYTAVGDDTTAMFHNPAGLGLAKGPQATAMLRRWIGESTVAQFGASKDLGSLGSLGLGILYLGLPPTTSYDEQGQEIGTFTMSDLAASLSWGRELAGGIYGGATLRFLQERIDVESAAAFSADLGVLAAWPGGWRAGLAAGNLGTGLKFLQESSPPPAMMRAGISKQLFADRLLGALDLVLPFEDDPESRLGLEFALAPQAKLRAGYAHEFGGRQLDGLTGLSGGLGLNVGWLSMDYAVTPWGDLGLTHFVSLSYGQAPASGEPSRGGDPRGSESKARKGLSPKESLAQAVNFLKSKNAKAALGLLDPLSKKSPRDSRIHYYKGVAYEYLGRKDKAMGSYLAARTFSKQGSKVRRLSSQRIEKLKKASD